MTPDREYELLARIEQLKDEVQAARTTIMEREQEVQTLRQTKEFLKNRAAKMINQDLCLRVKELEDRLRAAQSQGAV